MRQSLVEQFLAVWFVALAAAFSSAEGETLVLDTPEYPYGFQLTSPDNGSSLTQISTCCRLVGATNCKNSSIISRQLGKRFRSQFQEQVRAEWTVPSNLVSTKEAHTFILQERIPSCTKTKEVSKKTFSWTQKSSDGFLPNGYLRVGIQFYAPDEYCVNGISDQGIELHICPLDCGKSRACIPKCCSLDRIYSVGINGRRRGCVYPSGELENTYFSPQLYHDFNKMMSSEDVEQAPKPHFFVWTVSKFLSNCPQNVSLFPRSPILARNLSTSYGVEMTHLDFRIRKDGHFMYRKAVESKCEVQQEPERFMCFDRIQDYGDFLNPDDNMILFLCSAWKVEHYLPGTTEKPKELAYGILMITFSIFPLLTSVVYLSLWRKQNVHGWTISATTGTLFFMYIFQGTALVIGTVGSEINGTWGCYFIAIASHFFFLASFSWLTVMCCDLWWTFRSLQPANRRSKGYERFLKYSLFGWGFPGVFITVGMITDFLSDESCTDLIVPGYGKLSCWINPVTQGVYVYYPVAALISMNILFFIVTCIKLCTYRQNARFASKKETNHWQCFIRFSKLFLVMGVFWSFEIISWALDGYGYETKWYWIITDVINIIRSVGVFIVYVCKPDIIKGLEDNHPNLKRIFGHFKRKCSDDITEQTGSTAMNPPGAIALNNM